MRDSKPGLSNQSNGRKILLRVWKRLTRTQSTDDDNARWEYLTKVILVFILFVSIPFLIISIIGWAFHFIPFDTVVILAIMALLFVISWFLTHKGHQRIGAAIPCIILFASGVYGNYVGGIDAPAMLLYALAIVLAAIMLDWKAQIVMLILSLVSFLGFGLAHHYGYLITDRSASNMFLNRVSITVSALASISLGIWFLKSQFQLAIKEMRTSILNTRSLVETIVDGMVFSDMNGIIQDVNEAAIDIFKISNKQEVLGRNIVEFLPPDEKHLADSLRDSINVGTRKGSISCTGLLPSGEKINLEINSALFLDLSGQPAGFVSTIRDVSSRKQVENELANYREQLENLVAERTAKLKEAYDELESFSYSISHDLRSPLRGINGYVSLIEEEPDNQLSEKSKQYMKQIKDSAVRMGDLISDLLSFSRIIRQPVSRNRIEPAIITREIIDDLIAGDYQNQKVDFQVEDMPVCEADGILIYQVFYNLIDNALKYSRNQAKSKITIGTKKGEQGEDVFFVSDNGIGFDMKYSEKLFGVFQRLHNDPTYEGTGIGLATVYRIIQRHNGKIWVESKVNKGTTFFFTLDKCVPAES